ncbi:hypothetical protein PIB30_066881 [Stylosanthes scabra]|uniref:Uncharacterized protein n=1 Tax=Stylosanthes scabra TaxID=79078 RepID=A0ABU6SNQ1_9FABA|nr:hypothetical protein [Stylosanthes scabra]
MARKYKGHAVGIDLGSTYSCVGVWQEQHCRVEIIHNDQGNRTTPSSVAFTQNQWFIGDAAKNQAAANPTNTVFGRWRESMKDMQWESTLAQHTLVLPYGRNNNVVLRSFIMTRETKQHLHTLAITAALLNGGTKSIVPDLVLQDVTPLSLGQAKRRDVMSVVIPIRETSSFCSTTTASASVTTTSVCLNNHCSTSTTNIFCSI